MEDSYSAENIKRLCVFMFQTCSNSQLMRRVLWISAEQAIGASLKHKNTQPLYMFNRVRVPHLNSLKERTWLHSFVYFSPTFREREETKTKYSAPKYTAIDQNPARPVLKSRCTSGHVVCLTCLITTSDSRSVAPAKKEKQCSIWILQWKSETFYPKISHKIPPKILKKS